MQFTYPSISRDILQLSFSFPFAGSSPDIPGSLESILDYLPHKFSALTLCETYFAHGIWCSDIVTREELIEDILTPVYAYVELADLMKDQPQTENVETFPISPHRLAVFFFILAIGSLVDVTLPPGNIQAEGFFELGKACLALNNMFDTPELATLQALFLVHMFCLHGSFRLRYSPEAAWSVMGLCARLTLRVSVPVGLPQLRITHSCL